jgi:hypothetical protein
MAMRTVKSLIEELQKFPPEAMCYAYEGEIIGVVVYEPTADNKHYLGYVYCGEIHANEKETVIHGGGE